MLGASKNMKWELLLYFLISALLTAGVALAGWLYYFDSFTESQFRNGLYLISALPLIGLFVGYYAVRRYQRQLDRLHLGIIQVAKGNLAGRIPVLGSDALDRIYIDFNHMTEILEEKMKLLHKLGEENVLLQTQSNEAAVLEERKRLARDLHDSVSQQLFAIHMSASSLPKVIEQDSAKAKEVLEHLIHMSYMAQKQMRGLITQLRPLELEGKSLSDALDKWFPDYCRQNGLQGTMDIQLKENLSEATEHQLFLIIQEGMANVVKHASAQHATLSLQDTGHQIVLTISDDGCGFEPEGVRTGSYGLSTMSERARKLGGDAEILSRSGSGTRMKVKIPKFGKE